MGGLREEAELSVEGSFLWPLNVTLLVSKSL